MNSVKITFSNNEVLVLTEGDYIIPIIKLNFNDEVSTSVDKTYEILNHTHDGLLPSIMDLLCMYDFFKLYDKEKFYKSSSVVSIESL